MHKACKTSQHLSNMVRYRYDKEIYRTMHFSEKRQWQNSAFQKFGNLLYEKSFSEITRSKNRFGGLWTAYKMTSDKPLEIWKDYLNRWNEQYSNFMGITDVKKAQERVTELTNNLQELQGSRKDLQTKVDSFREQLLANHQDANRTKLYSEERSLIYKEAVEINNRLNEVRRDFDQCEREEKETFGKLFSWWNEQYSNIVGIKNFKKEQERVTELTNKLQELQSSRKVLQRSVDSFREQLLANQQNININERYSVEHFAILKGVEINHRLNEARKYFDQCETDEKETFGKLFSAIRDCHEALQSQAEKETFDKLFSAIRDFHEALQSQAKKFWGFIVSLVSSITCIAIPLFYFLNYLFRVKEIKEHITQSNGNLPDQTESHQAIIKEIKEHVIKPISNLTDQIESQKETIKEIVLAKSNSLNSKETVPDNDLSSVNSFPIISTVTAVGAWIGVLIGVLILSRP